MYTDLSILCKLIGFESNSELSTQASELYKAISGLTGEFSLDTGNGTVTLTLLPAAIKQDLRVTPKQMGVVNFTLSNSEV